jgi:hypothetical protein
VSGVPTLLGDSCVDQAVYGEPETLGPKYLTSKRLRPSGLVWSGEHTL